MNEDTLNPFELPEDIFEIKEKVFLFGIENRMESSLKHLKEVYPKRQKLYDACEFTHYCMSDAVKSTIEQIETIGFYPITEAVMELDEALKHALNGSYKAAFSDLRRALELGILSVYWPCDNVEKKKARHWVSSKLATPFMSEMMKKLLSNERFSGLNSSNNWRENLQEFFWEISDYSHNKGHLKGSLCISYNYR